MSGEYPKFNAAARAEVYKLLTSMEEMFERFAARDAESAAKKPTHEDWLNGRSAAYGLAADHIRRSKVVYEGWDDE